MLGRALRIYLIELEAAVAQRGCTFLVETFGAMTISFPLGQIVVLLTTRQTGVYLNPDDR